MEPRRPVGGIPGILILRSRRPVSRIGQSCRCPALESPVLEQAVIFRHGLEIPVQQVQRLDIYFVVRIARLFHDPPLGRLDAQDKMPEKIGFVVHEGFMTAGLVTIVPGYTKSRNCNASRLHVRTSPGSL